MIITTTQTVEGYPIVEYKWIVFGEVVAGVDAIKDIAAGLRNFFGGRSRAYEGELSEAREEALQEMEERATKIGANAVVGVKMDYEYMDGMIMVTCSGKAVVIDELQKLRELGYLPSFLFCCSCFISRLVEVKK